MHHHSSLRVCPCPLFATVLTTLAVLLAAFPAAAHAQYRNANEAYSAGAMLYNARKFAESREPFEAALKLADDDEFKVKVYRALMGAYRLLPEIDKMLEATDFIFEHGESAVEKSLIARSLTSFVRQRGKTAEVVQRNEQRLKEDPNDKPAVYTLSEIYHRAEPNPNRRKELLDTRAEIEKQDAAKLAAKHEQSTANDVATAAWNWKEAAAEWLKADDKQKAAAAVKKAEATGPESRNEMMAHYWHKGMGDVYLQLGEPKQAIQHYEQAIEKTTIEGYIKACQEQLAKARAAAGS